MASAKIASIDLSTDHFIDGKRVASRRTFANCSPIDGKHLADVSAGGAAEVDAAVAAARRAFPDWAALGPERALTGPVARGDEETVARQRAEVAARAPELLELFDALADATRALALGRGRSDPTEVLA